MRKHIWKIATVVLLIGCIILGYSVYDAERRVDLIARDRDELQDQVWQFEKQVSVLEDEVSAVPKNLTQISFDSGLAVSYFLSNNKAIVLCDFDGENLEREFAIVSGVIVTVCQENNIKDAIAIDGQGNLLMSSNDGNTLIAGKYTAFSNLNENIYAKYREDMDKIW